MFSCRIDANEELRLVEERHAEVLFTLVQQNQARLRQWVPWLEQVATLESTRQFIKRRLQRLPDNNGWTAGIWYQGQFAGEIGFDFMDPTHRFTEIGYWVGAAFEGKGLVHRACRVLVDHAFGELGLNRVQIRCAVENQRSRTIPEKLGFQMEGILRGIERLPDRFVDLVVYGMLAKEWKDLSTTREDPAVA